MDQLADSLADLRPARIGSGPAYPFSDSDSEVDEGGDLSAGAWEALVDIYKYVDDTTIVETLSTEEAAKHFSTAKSTALTRAAHTEALMSKVKGRAEDIGMRVNCAKTQLLMISPPNGFTNNAYINLSLIHI